MLRKFSNQLADGKQSCAKIGYFLKTKLVLMWGRQFSKGDLKAQRVRGMKKESIYKHNFDAKTS